jgi:hypothetical protein
MCKYGARKIEYEKENLESHWPRIWVMGAGCTSWNYSADCSDIDADSWRNAILGMDAF